MPMVHFIRVLTMVADGSAVSARIANASVLSEIHVPDENWMSCMVHILNNTMKTVLPTFFKSFILQVVVQDFPTMRKTIEDANLSAWKYFLLNACK